MRLPAAFLRLPFAVDANVLAREVDALDAQAWKDHPEGALGNTAVPLVAVNGDFHGKVRLLQMLLIQAACHRIILYDDDSFHPDTVIRMPDRHPFGQQVTFHESGQKARQG